MYEQAAREILGEKRQAAKTRWIWMRVAAAVIFILLSYVIFQDLILPDPMDRRTEWVENQYTFPSIQKSRSAETSVSDDLIETLRNKEYASALDRLDGDNLTEQDRYVKAHLLYATDKFDEARRFIQKNTWSDEYFAEEILWLDFLVAIRSGDSATELRKKAEGLSDTYHERAMTFLEGLRE